MLLYHKMLNTMNINNTQINCTGNYLSENITSFPFANKGEIKFIDKGITGCGGTTIAIETAINEGRSLVLALPTVSAVISKANQFIGKVAGIYGSNNLSDTSTNIIACTYDKLKSILTTLGRKSNNYEILIDEYHTLTRDCSYREVCRELITEIAEFKSVNLMSATPDTYLEEAITTLYPTRNFIKVKYDFNKKPLCKLINVKGSIKEGVKSIIEENLEDDKRCYYMINDIKLINSIISELALEKDQYHVMASLSRKYEVCISSIDEINTNLKPITFITAAGFEGVDFLDKDGEIYTLIDLQKDTTIFDWQTIIQMQGRCRGSKAYPTIIYHEGKYRPDQLESLKALNARINVANTIIGTINDGGTMNMYSNFGDIVGRVGDDGNVALSVNPFLLAEYNRLRERYNELQNISSLAKYLTSHNIQYGSLREIEGVVEKKKNNSTISFKKLVDMIVKGDKVGHYTNSELAKNAVEVLGYEEIKKLGFSKTKVEAVLKAKAKGKKTVEIDIKVGRFYSVKALDKILSTYASLNSYTFSGKTIDSKLKELGFYALPNRIKVNKEKVSGYFIKKAHGGHLFEGKVSNRVNALKSLSLCVNFSLATKPGSKVKEPKFKKATLEETYNYHKPLDKNKQFLISDCYNSDVEIYGRQEFNLNCADSLILDIDDHDKDKKDETKEPWTIERVNKWFEENLSDCRRYIYKTYSYTDEKQSFRVIVPLSSTLKFRTELNDPTNFKIAKSLIFSEFQDARCQLWYYSANLENQPVEYGDENAYLSVDYVRDVMDMVCLEKNEDMNVLEYKENPTKPTQKPKDTEYEASKFIKMINEAEGWGEVKGSTVLGHGDWNDKIWAAAYYVKWEDIDKVKEGIVDPLKLRYFEEKLRYKRK